MDPENTNEFRYAVLRNHINTNLRRLRYLKATAAKNNDMTKYYEYCQQLNEAMSCLTALETMAHELAIFDPLSRFETPPSASTSDSPSNQ